jgi:hypothetical protein
VAYYKGVLERLRNDVRPKSPQKSANGFVMLRATLPFSSISSCQTKKNTVCPRPPYSTDLAPCDSGSFQN